MLVSAASGVGFTVEAKEADFSDGTRDIESARSVAPWDISANIPVIALIIYISGLKNDETLAIASPNILNASITDGELPTVNECTRS